MATTTTIETFTYDLPGWVHVYNANVDKLNGELLKVLALADVDETALRDDVFLVWKASTSRWVLRRFKE